MTLRVPKVLRLSASEKQIDGLRRGFLGLACLASAQTIVAVLVGSGSIQQRLTTVGLLVGLVAAYGFGYRRQGFPPPVRAFIFTIVMLIAASPSLGPNFASLALTGMLYQALYEGHVLWTGPGFAVATIVSAAIQANHGYAIDPGQTAGQALGMVLIAGLIRQLRASIAERDALESRLARQALLDPLTELPNRHALSPRLEAAADRHRESGEPYAVLVLDLDGFKRINDTHGHEQGDELLREVARRALSCIRAEDLCARLGGDEFAVLLENCGQSAVDAVIRRLTEGFGVAIALTDVEEHVGVSIGVSWNCADPQTALRQADRAMYEAKGEPRAPRHAKTHSAIPRVGLLST
jgi:diguanylate cyclase (GGDEF)-like protein